MSDDFDPARIGIQLDCIEESGLADPDVIGWLRALVAQRVRRAENRVALKARRREKRAERERAEARRRLRVPGTSSAPAPLNIAEANEHFDVIMRSIWVSEPVSASETTVVPPS